MVRWLQCDTHALTRARKLEAHRGGSSSSFLLVKTILSTLRPIQTWARLFFFFFFVQECACQLQLCDLLPAVRRLQAATQHERAMTTSHDDDDDKLCQLKPDFVVFATRSTAHSAKCSDERARAFRRTTTTTTTTTATPRMIKGCGGGRERRGEKKMRKNDDDKGA